MLESNQLQGICPLVAINLLYFKFPHQICSWHKLINAVPSQQSVTALHVPVFTLASLLLICKDTEVKLSLAKYMAYL